MNKQSLEKSLAFCMIVVMFHLKNKYSNNDDDDWRSVESDYSSDDDWRSVESGCC